MNDLRIEAVWPGREPHVPVVLELPHGATLADALACIARRDDFPPLDLAATPVGIFGQIVSDRTRRLEQGDRIELYRPLSVDPMTARRLRISRRAD